MDGGFAVKYDLTKVEFTDGMVIHCDEEEKADALIEELYSRGFVWVGGVRLNIYNRWKMEGMETCYRIHLDNKTIETSPNSWYLERKNTIIQFLDLITEQPFEVQKESGGTMEKCKEVLLDIGTVVSVETKENESESYLIIGKRAYNPNSGKSWDYIGVPMDEGYEMENKTENPYEKSNMYFFNHMDIWEDGQK